MEFNLVLLNNKKYFIKKFNKNNLINISLIEELKEILNYVERHDNEDHCKKYILETTYIDQFVGNAEQKTGGVVIVPIYKNKILLLKNYRHQLSKDLYELPRGFIEPNEQPKQAAIRELKEETNLTTNEIINLGKIHADSGIIDDNITVFLLKIDNPLDIKLQSLEYINESYWYSFKEIQRLIYQNKITDSMTLSSLLLFQAKREKL